MPEYILSYPLDSEHAMLTKPPPKYRSVAKVLETRMAHGDYLVTAIPSTRRLAKEMGVSHIVACKAVELLTERGLLSRKQNGRLVMPQEGSPAGRRPRIAFVSPAFDSRSFNLLRVAVESRAEAMGSLFRPVTFVHWHDVVFREVLEGFDGMILAPSTEPITEELVELIGAATCRTATFCLDLTPHKIPCIPLFETHGVERLLDHLHAGGHRRIACLNTQPEDAVTLANIDAWKRWMDGHGLSGPLLNDPVKPYEDPLVRSMTAGSNFLASPLDGTTAVFCTTTRAAQGLIRAMVDRGLAPGRDLSVCTIDDEAQARYLVPSLTSVSLMPINPPVETVMDWMSDPTRCWGGPLTLRDATGGALLIGESTAPVGP